MAFEARAYYTGAYFELFSDLHKQLFDEWVENIAAKSGFSFSFSFFLFFVFI
jgi:hypothetical protein